jgi:hypothetical protein
VTVLLGGTPTPATLRTNAFSSSEPALVIALTRLDRFPGESSFAS